MNNKANLGKLNPVKIHYQVGHTIISLNTPSIEIINGLVSFTGTNEYGVRMTLQARSDNLHLVNTSVAVSQFHGFSTNNINTNILRETYKITDVINNDHFISIFYEQPSNQNYEKVEPMPSNNARFFGIDDETVDAFTEALYNNRNALNNYNSFINRNRNRPNVSNELKNEMPKDINRQYEHLKEFLKNNKEEIRRILDL